MSLVVIHLAPPLKLRGTEDDKEEDGDGHDCIWPASTKPRLLPSLWQSLPSDLLFHSVLVRLPFSVLLKLRSVSHSWRERLSSYDFWLLWFQGNSNPNPIQSCPLQKPSLNCDQDRLSHTRWGGPYSLVVENHIPFPVLDDIISDFGANPNNLSVPCLYLCSAASPGRQAARWLRQFSICYIQQKDGAATTTHEIPPYWSRLQESFMPVQDSYMIIAADKGLLLLATSGEGHQKLIVCNPLLRAHKVICNSVVPRLSDSSSMAVGFIVDAQCGEYRVFLCNVSCQVYNSSTGKWRTIPAELFRDSASVSLPILNGSYFWLSLDRASHSSNGESTLFAYHADADLVTCMHTRFPQVVTLPNRVLVWKDSDSLQTLAWSSTLFGTWKLVDGLWRVEKKLPINRQHHFTVLSTVLDCVKADKLLILRFSHSNPVFVFNFGLDRGCFLPGFFKRDFPTGHCVFQPSCIQV